VHEVNGVQHQPGHLFSNIGASPTPTRDPPWLNRYIYIYIYIYIYCDVTLGGPSQGSRDPIENEFGPSFSPNLGRERLLEARLYPPPVRKNLFVSIIRLGLSADVMGDAGGISPGGST